MSVYENFLFCIFMNINENLKNELKPIELKNEDIPTQILISQQQLILEHITWYQINSFYFYFLLLLDGQTCKLSNLNIHEY